ncbi:hypothetical protein NK718_17795 [Alsobacter sp. SYSU M60028]|uniref:Uncharacterized protein n=1 Tax=Alsobacter ponti TaxID=2962936 RepID=A0ABT1LG12_9HYPH|nr:hypothetical protein [Alsobacter ponti]MCP8940384.1 hypothetical protein [Alsobacter ponti]
MTKPLLTVFAALALTACAPTPPDFLLAPARPTPGAPLPTSAVTAGARHDTPAEPKGWDEMNRRVAPPQGTAP